MNCLTEAQRITASLLEHAGFAFDGRSRAVIRMKRGTDYRLVQLDGVQKRALGARR